MPSGLGSTKGANNAKDDGGIGMEEFRDLKNQISSLRAGQHKPNKTLRMPSARAKSSLTRGVLHRRWRVLRVGLGARKSGCSRTRITYEDKEELEETRRKEIRLRDKLKELRKQMEGPTNSRISSP